MRGGECDERKPDGTLRVIALGDSWTFGVGVEAEETWPSQLEKALAAKGRTVEVLNTGVSGYETYHEALRYRREFRAFEHDVVVVGYYPVNDVHDKRRKYRKIKLLHDLHPWLYEAYIWPERNLYLKAFLDELKRKRKGARRSAHYAEAARGEAPPDSPEGWGFAPGDEDWTAYYTDAFSGWRSAKDSMASIAETARMSGAKACLVLFPDIQDLARYEGYCHPKVAPLIERAATEAGLEFIDVRGEFSPFVGRETEVVLAHAAGGTHPNAFGYSLIGKAVARELEARGVVPQAAR
jgi:lysophospholipase L1-like esterase